MTPRISEARTKGFQMSETVNECSAACGCSTAGEISSSLADLRTAEEAIRDEPYDRLPALAGMLAIAAHRLEVTYERSQRLEAALSYAISTERRNTDDWMRGMCDNINEVLVADCDHQRCVYNGDRLFLRSIRQVVSP